MGSVIIGLDGFDLFNHVHAVNDFAKHRVTPALVIFAGMVEEVVVCHVNKELGRRRVWIHGARHCDAADGVFQAIIGFVLNRFGGLFFIHAWSETATLDHETVDDTVKKGVVVVTLFHIRQKIFDSSGRLIGTEFQFYIAERGVKNDHIHALCCCYY